MPTIGWDPDADYGGGDDWAAQVDLSDWSGDNEVYLSIPVTMPGSASDAYTGVSIWVYCRESFEANSHSLMGALYANGTTKVTNSDTVCRTDIGTTYSWVEFTFSTAPTLNGGDQVHVCIGCSTGNGTLQVRGGTDNFTCTNPPAGVTCGAPRDNVVTNRPCTALDSSVTLTGNNNRTAGIYLEYSIVGGTTLTVAAMDHTHSMDSPALTQNHILVSAAMDHAHSLDSPTLTQNHILAIQDISHAHALDAVEISTGLSLTVDAMLHAHAMDQVALAQNHVLVLAQMAHGHTLDAATIVQNHVLSVLGMDHAHVLDTFAIGQNHVLSVLDMQHAHSIDAVSLSAATVLAIQDMLHAHAMDGVALTQAHVLIVDAMTHQHIMDQVAISLGYSLPSDRIIAIIDDGRILIIAAEDRRNLQ